MKIPAMKYPGVVFGEVLWDILPTGAVPGGAPMNVAFHLNRLGHKARLISRVGIDDEGKKLMGIMEKNNIPTELFQLDMEYETGKVIAHFAKNHEITYEIKQSVAWDNIQWENDFGEIMTNSSFLVFGSLAARSDVNRKTLYRLLESARFKILDINLRPPFFDKQTLEPLLQHADFLKMNHHELELITGWFANYASDHDRVKVLQSRFKIPDIVITKGSEGASYYTGDTVYEHPGFKVNVEDTVGSGDAFLAGIIKKLTDQASPAEALEYACALGALIATYRGPCPAYELEEVEKQIIHQQNIRTMH